MIRMSWLLILLIFSSAFYYSSEARGGKKNPPSALVVGTVFCDTCFQKDFSKASHFISGALVAVECDGSNSKLSFRKKVKTNQHGEFKVHLPFSVSKHVKKIQGCSVNLVRSSEPYCAVASTATSSSLRLKSRKAGTHIFSAGFFTFKPLTQPNLCNQKPSMENSKKLTSADSLIPNSINPSFPPPIQDPPMPILPPIDDPGRFSPIPILPRLPPLPELPPLPSLPPLPFLPPIPRKEKPSGSSPKSDQLSNDQKTFAIPFPPNPFQPPSVNPLQPPPSVVPPVFPSPPPSILPPVFPSPPQTPTFPPTLPSPSGIVFSPILNPPPPLFPIHLPPFPFQPSPGFPGVPPAASSSLLKKKNP